MRLREKSISPAGSKNLFHLWVPGFGATLMRARWCSTPKIGEATKNLSSVEGYAAMAKAKKGKKKAKGKGTK
jgi:hypothetical protein